MRIACAQLLSGPDPDANLRLVRDYAERAAAEGANLVVFPEATMASFATRSASVAQPLDGPFATAVREIAGELGLVLAVGMFTPGADADRPHNTLLVTGRGVEASYDKIHLFDVNDFAESDHVTPGYEPVLVEVGGLRLGLAICYDVRFPELFKHYANHGADAVLVPASWRSGEGRGEQWRAIVIARATDATSYVVACDQADARAHAELARSKAPLGAGRSCIVGPLGDVLAEAGGEPDLIVADLDADTVARARRAMPVLANTRFHTVPPRDPDAVVLL
ncbi:carbon-nitrogen hydrolase family protein [Nigerium massiliense]|uniref:carbon-nitrogen hydrolase family protein n=1 Tax=Nigerium massiliense TaxID=1522317 RepID=UPI000693EBEA|nr:carbon-nitrogen hydrolase family protein [Nigerium massiliense]